MNSAINYSGFVDLLKKPSTNTIHFDKPGEAEKKQTDIHHQVRQSLDLRRPSTNMEKK